VNIGGIAGGDKYLVRSVLFKVARDPRLASNRYMYGVHEEKIEYAMKVSVQKPNFV
jgi:hypothetical protein